MYWAMAISTSLIEAHRPLFRISSALNGTLKCLGQGASSCLRVRRRGEAPTSAGRWCSGSPGLHAAVVMDQAGQVVYEAFRDGKVSEDQAPAA
jgi:hypothetical protein